MSEEKEDNDFKEVVLNEGDTESDTVRISPEVISMVAGLAAHEVAGVAGMSGSIVGGIAERLGKKDFSRGIKVNLDNQEVTLDLYLIVEYGYRIQEVAEELKKAVRGSIEDTTGLTVSKVNIHVQGIHLSDRESAREEAEGS